MPAAYFLYARKSTDDEDRQILSIESQLNELRAFAKREGLTIAEEFIEAKTAKEPGRPIFNLMIEQVELSKAQGLLAWHPDRLARNSVDGGRLIYLVDTGKLTDLRFPTYRFDNTAQGKFMLAIAFGQSKYYIDNLSENVKRGFREKLRHGVWPGAAPLGYLNDYQYHTIVMDPHKSVLVRKVFELYATGDYSLEELHREVGRWGLTGRRAGKPVHKNVLAALLKNPFYYGMIRWRGEHYEASHPPLVSKRLFDRVQQVLAQQSKPVKHGRIKYHLIGLVRCAECGCMITAETQKGHVYYRCTKKRGACSQGYLREEALLAQIRKAIIQVSIDTETKNNILRYWQEQRDEASNASASRSHEIAQRLQRCDEQMDRLLDLYIAREIGAEEYQRKKAKLLGEKQELKEALGAIENGSGGWLEPARAFLTTCHEAGSVAWQENPPALKHFVRRVGSNVLLDNRTLSLTYSSPFDLVSQTERRTNWRGRRGSNPQPTARQAATLTN